MPAYLLPRPAPWTRQPQGSVDIDWRHPLTRGLALVVNGSSYGRESVSRRIAAVSTSSRRVLPAGAGPFNAGSSAVVRLGFNPLAGANGAGAGLTLFSLSNPASGASPGVLVGSLTFGGGFNQISLAVNSDRSFNASSGRLALVTYNGAFLSSADAGGVVNGSMRQFCGVYVADNTAPRLFVDGRELSATATAVAGGVGVPAGLSIGAQDDNNRAATATYLLTLGWNRALSALEVAALSENPWQLFAPATRRIYVDFGATDGTAPGTTLTAVASVIAGAASGQANATAAGVTLTAAASVLAGAATGQRNATAAGATLTAAASVVAGSAVGQANATAAGATLTATAALIPGSASGQRSATAVGATLTATASLLPGAASGASAATAAGATITATASVLPGAASGSSAATAGGATISATASVLAAGATGQRNVLAPGATTVASASLIAGTATAGASATAAGATVSATASLVAGAATGQRNATAAGTTLQATSALLPGTATGAGNATAPGAVITASASVIGGTAIGSGSGLAAGAVIAASAIVIPGVASAVRNATAPGALVTATASLIAGGTGSAAAYGVPASLRHEALSRGTRVQSATRRANVQKVNR